MLMNSVLMFVLWYCYKRGREERLKMENGQPVDGADRVEELADDPLLPAPHPETTRVVDDRDSRSVSSDEVPPPPAGGAARPSRRERRERH